MKNKTKNVIKIASIILLIVLVQTIGITYGKYISSENDNWVKFVANKLVDDEFVDDTFKLFEKSKISKDELKREPVSDR